MYRANKWLFLPFMTMLPLLAQSAGVPSPAGSVIVRVDDGVGNGRCIGSADKLTVTLRRIIVEKQSKWLGLVSDKELGITLTTTVSGSSSDEGKSAAFARVVKEQVEKFGDGQISLAQEQSLLSKFALTNGQNVFTVVDLETGIVRTEGKSVAAKVLLGAVNATKSLALPANPFASAYGVATTYVNSVFEPLLDEAASAKEAVSHHIVMNINAANCAPGDEKTGTKAIIDAVDDPALPGYIDTGKINSYCLKADLTPAFSLKYASMPSSGNCAQASNYNDLQNSYLAFYVNALPSETPRVDPGAASLMSPPDAKSMHVIPELINTFRKNGLTKNTSSSFSKAIASNEKSSKIAKAFHVKAGTVDAYRESLKRCQAHGTPIEQCF